MPWLEGSLGKPFASLSFCFFSHSFLAASIRHLSIFFAAFSFSGLADGEIVADGDRRLAGSSELGRNLAASGLVMERLGISSSESGVGLAALGLVTEPNRPSDGRNLAASGLVMERLGISSSDVGLVMEVLGCGCGYGC